MIRRIGSGLLLLGLCLPWVPASGAESGGFSIRLASLNPGWLQTTGPVQLQLIAKSAADVSGEIQVRISQQSLIGRSQITDALVGNLDVAMSAPIATQSVDLTADSSRLNLQLPASAFAGLADGVYAVQTDLKVAGKTQTLQTLLPILRGTVQQKLRLVPLLQLTARPTLVGDHRYSSAAAIDQFGPRGSALGLLQGAATSAGLTWLIDPDLLLTAQSIAEGGAAVSDAGYEVSSAISNAAQSLLDEVTSSTNDDSAYLMQFAGADLSGLVAQRRMVLAERALTQDAAARTLLARADLATAVVAQSGDFSDRAWDWLSLKSNPLTLLDSRRWPAKSTKFTPPGVIAAPNGRKALVADDQLSTEFTVAMRNSVQSAAFRQAWISDLLQTALEAPGTSRTIVIQASSAVSGISASATNATLAGLRLPWVTITNVEAALQATATNLRSRKSNRVTAVFSSDDLQRIAQLDRRRSNLTEIITGTVHETRLLQNELRTTSGNFTTSAQRQLYLNQAMAEQQSIEHAVRIVSSGSVMLPGESAAVPITIRNDLSVPVTVSVSAVGVPSVRVTAAQMDAVTIGAGKRKSIEIDTLVRGSDTAQLRLQLHTESGKPIGNPVTIQLASSAYGRVAGAAVGAAFGLLLLLVLLNVWRRVRQRLQTNDG